MKSIFRDLKTLWREAEKRKIIVELALFCPFYEDIQWSLSPMNSINNVNGVGPTDRLDVYTLDKIKGIVGSAGRISSQNRSRIERLQQPHISKFVMNLISAV